MRRRAFGAKARVWTAWQNMASWVWCDADGVLNQYNCDGTYTIYYQQQVRYFQFLDGTGRTATEYRAGAEVFRGEQDGMCGYEAPLVESPYVGRSDTYYGAYLSTETGTIWRRINTNIGYDAPSGGNLVAPAVYCWMKGTSWEIYSPTSNPNGSRYGEVNM